MMNDYKILGIPQPKYSHVFLNNVIFMSTLFTVVGSRHLVFLQSNCLIIAAISENHDFEKLVQSMQ